MIRSKGIQTMNGYNDCSHDIKNLGYEYAESVSETLEDAGFSPNYIMGYEQRLREERTRE